VCRAVLAAAILASSAIGSVAIGQETTADPPAAAQKKFRGRLPNYYRHVVDQKQREAIYAIQEEYAAKIAALQAQLDAMVEERDGKVAGVLTAEQAQKVKQLADEAKAKRDAKKTAETPPDESEKE